MKGLGRGLWATLRRVGRAAGAAQTAVILSLVYLLVMGPLACARRAGSRRRRGPRASGWMAPSAWTPPRQAPPGVAPGSDPQPAAPGGGG